ncbi:MAG TPA: helix-turn-helix transcriptional regulator [Phycisphaerae bacterium]|nr:helix-turn-helix transcriptional regulator [Phycisphaerae bacterium]
MGSRVQHTVFYRRLCTLLRELREKANLSQRALALKLKKPPSYVHKCEVGDRRVDPVEFLEWCRCCEVDIHSAWDKLQDRIS